MCIQNSSNRWNSRIVTKRSIFIVKVGRDGRWDGAVNLLKRNNISLPTRTVSASGTDSPAGPPLNKLENCLLRTHGLYFTPFKRCHNIIDTHARV